MTNPNAPQFILTAVLRIYDDLPALVGADWVTIQPQADAHITALKAQPNSLLESTQLFGLLARYEPARQRMATDLKVQEVINASISSQMEAIAEDLRIDLIHLEGLSAATFAHLDWEVDPTTVPKLDEDFQLRGISLTIGGVDGATSVKFKNMRLTSWNFTVFSAGFVTTSFDMVNTPHPLFIAGCVVLIMAAFRDALKVELSQQDASVFWALVQSKQQGREGLSEAEVRDAANAERKKYGLVELNELQMQHSLNKLERIHSIELLNGGYFIIEEFTIND